MIARSPQLSLLLPFAAPVSSGWLGPARRRTAARAPGPRRQGRTPTEAHRAEERRAAHRHRRRRARRALWFYDGTIRGVLLAAGNSLAFPNGMQPEVIDLQGKHVFPGMIAANTQLGLVEITAVRQTVNTDEVDDLASARRRPWSR